MTLLFVFLLGFVGFIPYWIWKKYSAAKRRRRLAYIQQYVFPAKIFEELTKHFQLLSKSKIEQVEKGLRSYFSLIVSNGSDVNNLAMPSYAVDVFWHEFIMLTQDYKDFCDEAFCRFLDHAPFAAMRSQESPSITLRNTWVRSCKDENINPAAPLRLPLLFALDADLEIPGGCAYSVENGIYPKPEIKKKETRVLVSKLVFCFILISPFISGTLRNNILFSDGSYFLVMVIEVFGLFFGYQRINWILTLVYIGLFIITMMTYVILGYVAVDRLIVG